MFRLRTTSILFVPWLAGLLTAYRALETQSKICKVALLGRHVAVKFWLCLELFSHLLPRLDIVDAYA